MTWSVWTLLLLSLAGSVRPFGVAAQTHGRRSAVRKLYVLQPGTGPGPVPGPGPGPGPRSTGTLVPSLPRRQAASSYQVELGPAVRTRRMEKQAASAQESIVRHAEQNQNKQLLKHLGVNVCGGQCCHGWSKAQGSQRCTKPNCVPQCQNRGMCLRPQLCVCKPGSSGKACEQTTGPAHTPPAQPGNGPANGGHTAVPRRPIPQQVPPQAYDLPRPQAGDLAQVKLTVKASSPQLVRPPQYSQQQMLSVPVHPGQQYLIKPQYYHAHSQPQLARPIPLAGHDPTQVGNHTGRIKVVFTPTICKLTCMGGRCHNNCEQGNTTTIISENGHATDTLTAPNFRVVVCHLPCINGGKCSARDKCQCPPNFTGKFCQIPVQGGHQQRHQTSGGYSQTQVHSTHTLPLTYSNGPGFSPNIVKIHIKHPPEASVQVHQVSRLDSYQSNGQSPQSGSSSSSSYSFHHTESQQTIQQHGYNVVYPGQNGDQALQYQPVSSHSMLGRCFQETVGSQCGKALPGLTKQEQCCGTIGTSWGFHKCQKCPKKPSAIPLIDCPQGYKRINSSHCQANISAVQEDKGACFRLVSSGRQCLHPVSAQLSKQLCCCSVGKAWGPHCAKCPPPGTAMFKEICPGGMGYTVLPNPPASKPVTVNHKPIDPLTPQPSPTLEKPVVVLPKPEEIIPEVVEESSPPVPVEVFPSNAGQDIAPTQFAEVDECQINPYICGQGVCYNKAEGYTCHCHDGYRLDDAPTSCVDVDDCLESPWLCSGGLCQNTEGSFLCVCPQGFLADEEGTSCVDVDECVNRTACPSGICINTPGAYHCASCNPGFLAQGGRCVDVDECQDQRVCTRGHCVNSEGSFFCQCGPGFRVSPTGDQCDDVDECSEDGEPCRSVGECRNNVGSYVCICPRGYRRSGGGPGCRDVDECADEPDLCSPHGECLNTEGSYLCVCGSGFAANPDTPSCEDIDECGLNETLCGPHGFCENRLGSFRCLCDQGYQETQDQKGCTDINECEMLSSVCGEARCANVDGSFLCVCPGGQEYNVMVARCEPVPTASPVERKECYFRLNDENLCESVLTSHVTLQECCCTLGAGWGDNCEVHPCPVNGTDQFQQMCPSGKGFIPGGDLLYEVPAAQSFKNADECTLFGQEVCKGGFCQDTVGGYECYCKTGQDYDPAKLECRDINECLDESVCLGGQCLNTEGSYICFCTHPMVLDPNSNRCIFAPEAAEQHEGGQTDFQGICWQKVTESMACTRPLGPNRKTTFTECCCLFGEAWGMDCALCPTKNTGDYAAMCNLPMGEGQHPYGRDALVAGPVHEYEVSPDYSPSPDQQSFYDEEEYSYQPFEGLRAEECGVLNGCENGRCVRVQEGYTCECFDGYTLDLSRMVCIDVNECSELNGRMSLCKNAKCFNTVGSYRCECLPGFTASEKPNYCVETAARRTSTRTQ